MKQTDTYKQNSKVINDFLETWDFLGVISDDHKGEYSDLINTILKLLKEGTNQRELSESLSKVITNNYGIDMKASDEDIQSFSKQLLEWWNAKE